jgi:ABC-type sugar transport system ATPase subunit
VRSVLVLGAETLVHLDIEGERLLARAPANFAAAPGTPVVLDIPPDRVHFFDRSTGLRVERPPPR